MVKVNGFRLQHRIRELSNMRDVYTKQFSEGRYSFPGEEKRTPVAAMKFLGDTERQIVELQVAQAEFNTRVRVSVDGMDVPLMYAIKMLGSLGRMEKMWRSASKGDGERYRYNDFEKERDKDKIYAVSSMTMEEYAAKSREAGARASRYREAIAMGNATALEMDVDPGLFE